MTKTAVLLAHGLLGTPFAKTTNGLIRGPSRYRILGVIDPQAAGQDAGELLDGRHRSIPVHASLTDLIHAAGAPPDACLVGVATVGGVLPAEIRAALLEAADLGVTLINGLHQLLAEDPEIHRRVHAAGGSILDIRRPKPTSELRFWTGEVLEAPGHRVAVLGTDCAIGKRTTAMLLRQALNACGHQAEMIYTGQTGWLQGMRYGFIFDATPNDFVCGELEGAIMECVRQQHPEILLLEGQSGLRNPSGPCGAELVLAGACHGVVLQHAPGRRHYEDLEDLGCQIPPIEEEIEMIRLMGVDVWALGLHTENLDEIEARAVQRRLSSELGIPVVLPLTDGVGPIVEEIERRIARKGGSR